MNKIIFDGHADIFSDVYSKQSTNVFEHYHLSKFRIGGVSSGIFVMWVDPELGDAKEHFSKMLKITISEISQSTVLHLVKEYNDFSKGLINNKISFILGIEGLDFIDTDIDYLKTLYEIGVRHLSLTWNYQNALAGGVKSDNDIGLSPLGIEVVKLIESLGIILDVSHLNERSFWDCIRISSKPIIASHSNCKSICNHPRNLTDEQIIAIAKTGGVIGINAFPAFINDTIEKQDLKHLVDHIDYLKNLVGIDYIGFGFDFCDYVPLIGYVKTSSTSIEDVTKVSNLINELRNRGYSDEDIDKISSLNFLRVFKTILK